MSQSPLLDLPYALHKSLIVFSPIDVRQLSNIGSLLLPVRYLKYDTFIFPVLSEHRMSELLTEVPTSADLTTTKKQQIRSTCWESSQWKSRKLQAAHCLSGISPQCHGDIHLRPLSEAPCPRFLKIIRIIFQWFSMIPCLESFAQHEVVKSLG